MFLRQTLKKVTILLSLSPLLLAANLNQATNLQLTASSHSVSLSWHDTNTQESGYKIFRNGILIAVTDADVEHYIDMNVDRNTLYRYTVKATDEVGDVLHAKRAKMVFGYYHFHEMNDITDAQTDWDNFTHVGWHFVQLTSSATYTVIDEDAHIWPTTEDGGGGGLHDLNLQDTKNRLDMLHSKGIKVYLGVMAAWDVTKAMLGDSAWREQAIDSLILAMQRGGADGLDIDIENQAVEIDASNIPDAMQKIENLYNFLKELRIEMDDRGLYDKAVHIAAPVHFALLNSYANSPVKKILNIVDSYFVMGYDMKWTPNASSHSMFRWGETYAAKGATYASDYGWSDMRAIADLSRGVDASLRSKIILGVPYYSYEYLTDSGDFAATKIKGFIDPDDNTMMHEWAGREISYSDITDVIAQRNLVKHIDYDTFTNWISWQDDDDASLWHQVYFEDSDTLYQKYRFINEAGLGGTGMWAIGMHQSSDFDALLWDEFHTDIPPREGSVKNPIMITTLPYHDSSHDTSDGSPYFNYYGGSCDANQAMYGFEYVYAIDITQRGHLDISLDVLYDSTKLSIQLLDSLDEKSCLAQEDSSLYRTLNPGRYYIVIDTKVINMVDERGEYTLDVNFVAE